MKGSVWIQLDHVELRDVARIMDLGDARVIAGGEEGSALSPPDTTVDEDARMDTSDRIPSDDRADLPRDDQVPLEELWPPLDEPDDGPGTEVVPPVGPDRPAGLRELSSQVAARAAKAPAGHRAPLITVVSGRGGVGKTTLVAAMAACAARSGLRAAVLDLDLMFGDLPSILGVESFRGLETVAANACDGRLAEEDIETAAMRVGPGLTLWGPLEEGEAAELHGATVEQLIGVLRSAADVIFADTSVFWGDAVAVAVSACDRCLVVGAGGEAAGGAAAHVVGLAGRLGVPITRMTSVFNRFGERGAGEEEAIRFEMATSLRSRLRVASGGEEVAGMSTFGKLDALVAGNGPFARSVRECTAEVLGELGCKFDGRLCEASHPEPSRSKLRLPWLRKAGAGR